MLAALLFASVLAAQSAPRALGLVSHRDGTPWANAVVHLIYRPLSKEGAYCPAEELTARTDARGRFSLLIRPSRAYSVFAQAEEPLDGSIRATNVVENVTAHVPVLLTEREKRLPTRTLPIANRALWKAAEPLRFRLYDKMKSTRITTLGVGKTCTLPPHFGETAVLEVTGKLGSGRMLLLEIPLDAGQRPLTYLKFPKPIPVALQVMDARTKKPVPGATIYTGQRDGLSVIGKADSTGAWKGTLAKVTALNRLGFNNHTLLFASSPKHVIGEAHRLPKPVPPEGKVDLTICLQSGENWRGKFITGAGRPLPGLLLYSLGVAAHEAFQGRKTIYQTPFRQVSHTSADGAFDLELGARDQTAAVLAVLTPTIEQALPEGWRRGLQPLVLLSARRKNPARLSLDQFAGIELRTVRGSGEPIAGAAIEIRSLRPENLNPVPLWSAVSDRLGVVRLLLPPLGQFAIAVNEDSSSVIRLLESGTAAGPGKFHLVTIPIGEPRKLRGQLRRGNGTPFANANVGVAPSFGRAHFDWVYDMPASQVGPARIKDFETGRLPRCLFGAQFFVSTRTDATGKFEIVLPDVEMTYEIDTRGNGALDPETKLVDVPKRGAIEFVEMTYEEKR